MATVYVIRNAANGKQYVGVTRKSPAHRLAEHIRAARRGAPQALPRAIRKHGAEQFSITAIATDLSPEEAQAREIAEIAARGTLVPAGYNVSLGGETMAGVPKSAHFRMRVSATLSGRAKAPEHIAKVAAALTGKTLPAATRAKIAAARAAQVFPRQVTEKRTAKLRGRKHTPQAVANMAAAQKGRVVTQAHRAAIARTLGALTDDQVRMIRANPDRLTGRELAVKFGVAPQTICGIRKGRSYRHVAP